MIEKEIKSWLRFSHMELTARIEQEIFTRFSYDLNEFLSLSQNALNELDFLTPKMLERYNYWKSQDVSIDLKQIEKLSVLLMPINHPNYPKILKTIYDPPSLLYIRGNFDIDEDDSSLGIVGSRSASVYGMSTIEQISSELSRYGIKIVSGGARGIDTAAHKGALKSYGITYVFLGCGVDVCYPSENKILFDSIISNGGAIISEYPIGSQPEPWRFPARNRLISGISNGVLVCQAPLSSGSLITANYALEQGRDVFAIPGNVNDRRNSGSNKLIKEGAALIETATDVLCALGINLNSNKEVTRELAEEVELNDIERKIYNLLTLEPQTIDHLVSLTLMSVSEISATLTILELKGCVKRQAGNAFIRL